MFQQFQNFGKFSLHSYMKYLFVSYVMKRSNILYVCNTSNTGNVHKYEYDNIDSPTPEDTSGKMNTRM